ncbi:MAG: hypothetical protein FD156_1434 [Nitrospirae bacterium]|nr:MAG: hypothetical protein FD156_1434 [Nitrospirota bacterium]
MFRQQDMVFERFYFADILIVKNKKVKRQNSSEGNRPRMSENAMSCCFDSDG